MIALTTEPLLAQRRASRRGPGALAPGSSTDASVVVGVDPALLADTNAVMDHLFCREKLWMVPPTFLDGQPAVTEASRAMLVDVIVDISMAYKMHDETVHLATTYLDMHLACAPVRRDDLHLLGVGCLLVASKFEEVHPPEIDDLVDRFSSDTNFWDRDDLLAMEQRVLHALGFTLSFATPAAFLRRFVGAPKLGGADPLPHLAAYLCELSLLDACLVAFAPSLRAAAATSHARAATGARPAWPRRAGGAHAVHRRPARAVRRPDARAREEGGDRPRRRPPVRERARKVLGLLGAQRRRDADAPPPAPALSPVRPRDSTRARDARGRVYE